MSDDLSDYDRYVAALPKEFEPGLRDGDNAPTAFYQARRAGWDLDVLIQDAQFKIRRGGELGVLINRLRTLATQNPTSAANRRKPWEPPTYIPAKRARLPASWVKERRQLVGKIARERRETGKPTPEEADQMMQALIAEQNARLSSVDQ